MGTTSPTEGITCPHGGRLPERSSLKAKRVAVPPSVWDYFASMWDKERSLAAVSGNGNSPSGPENMSMDAATNGVIVVPDGY